MSRIALGLGSVALISLVTVCRAQDAPNQAADVGAIKLNGPIGVMHFTSDPSRLVSYNTQDHVVYLWNAVTGELMRQHALVPMESPARGAFSEDGKTLVFCRGDAMEVWDVFTRERISSD